MKRVSRPGRSISSMAMASLSGAALSKHKDVDMMSFTGSTRAGIAVSKDAADTVKRVTLELGGKSPNIVFEDADLEDRVTGSVIECFNNSGQSCDAPTRMLVQRSVYDKAVRIARRPGARLGSAIRRRRATTSGRWSAMFSMAGSRI